MKKIITIYLFIAITIISFVFGLYFCPQCLINKCSEIKEDCNYYVYYKNEKLCIPEKVKNYIEQLQMKGEDRMKSKRGIFPK